MADPALELQDDDAAEEVLVLAPDWRLGSDIAGARLAARALEPAALSPPSSRNGWVSALRPAAREVAPAADEAALRDLVADLVREELHGSLGRQLTGAVRRLVRSEVARIASAARPR